ncbi:MAG: YebC/PmpR family DNA-binding transcriptional regulator [Phycisphaerales bacterium]|nr:YebC/PmpR family DNA-binding transcriptional regulator [Phycisphaerales bacterium]
MAGHSHWARIKRAKGANDARRGREWSRLSRGIIMAARSGGGDPGMNLSLRYAIDAAKEANMPKDTIERAIKKGTGELGGAALEELVYEGFGPAGAAVMCKVLTDNRNRTAGEIKKLFELRGGNLGASNSVARMFQSRGVFLIPADLADEDTLTSIALESGADDVQASADGFELSCEPSVFGEVLRALEAANIKPASAEVTMVATTTVPLAGAEAERMMKLIDALEEYDDTEAVYSNFELSAADAARLAAE